MLKKRINKNDKFDSISQSKKIQKSPNLFIVRVKLYIFYSVILFLIIGTALTLLSYVLFKVETIEVNGYNSKYDNKSIISASGFKNGENLLLCNSKRCVQNILTTMPYIGKVKVYKQIPNKITLKVEEAIPTTIIRSNDVYFVLDKDNKILEIRDNPIDNVLIVDGISPIDPQEGYIFIQDDDNKSYILCSMLKSIRDNDLPMTNEINIEDTISIYFIYDYRIKVLIGNYNNIDYKIRSAEKILKNNISIREKGILDVSLSYENNHSYFTPDYML